MKTLYLDCAMGAAGDMLTAALLELLPDPEGFVEELNGLGIPHVSFSAEKSVKCGITGTHMSVRISGHTEDEEMENYHAEHHRHSHSGLQEIAHLISHMDLPAGVAQNVLSVYGLIAQAESHVHGVPVSQVHFHEVGSLDAVADVTAVCLLMDRLSPDQVVVSPVHVGAGTVRCAHGILPVPAPATAYLLQGVPIYGGAIQSELCTPTGAALLKFFGTKFGEMPAMTPEKIGYGMGKKDFPAANCVRAVLGQSAGEPVCVLSCNLDDMTGEEIGFAVEELEKENPAEVYTTAISMKKSRTAVMLTVVCSPEEEERMVKAMFRHTTTLGIRRSEQVCYRRSPEK